MNRGIVVQRLFAIVYLGTCLAVLSFFFAVLPLFPRIGYFAGIIPVFIIAVTITLIKTVLSTYNTYLTNERMNALEVAKPYLRQGNNDPFENKCLKNSSLTVRYYKNEKITGLGIQLSENSKSSFGMHERNKFKEAIKSFFMNYSRRGTDGIFFDIMLGHQMDEIFNYICK